MELSARSFIPGDVMLFASPLRPSATCCLRHHPRRTPPTACQSLRHHRRCPSSVPGSRLPLVSPEQMSLNNPPLSFPPKSPTTTNPSTAFAKPRCEKKGVVSISASTHRRDRRYYQFFLSSFFCTSPPALEPPTSLCHISE